MKTVEFTIIGNPFPKKNSQNIVKGKNGKPVIVQNDRWKRYERACKQFMPEMEEPITEPINVRYLFFRDSYRRVDASNLIEGADDLLVKYGVIADDNFTIVKGHDGTRVYVDKDNPRTLVRIEAVDEFLERVGEELHRSL